MSDNKLTAKQEQFAQLVANGSPYNAAYAQAYNADGMQQADIDKEASVLANSPKIAPRIKAIQAEIRKELNIDREGQTIRLQTLSEKAEADGNLNAAINAEKEINKLHGLIPDKKHVEHHSEIKTISGVEAGL